MAITKYDQFDFLIDIVPRDEVNKPAPSTSVIKTEASSTGVRTNNQDQVILVYSLTTWVFKE